MDTGIGFKGLQIPICCVVMFLALELVMLLGTRWLALARLGSKIGLGTFFVVPQPCFSCLETLEKQGLLRLWNLGEKSKCKCSLAIVVNFSQSLLSPIVSPLIG